jgi:hypothetical protein
VGPPEYVPSDPSPQCSHGYPQRLCLLKGCGQYFQPSHPLQRYCSPSCHQAARDWQRWRAARLYRGTTRGRQQRCAQSRRYRQRPRGRQAAAAAVPSTTETVDPPREGQRSADFSEDCSGTPCRRPGCYVLFQPQPHEPPHGFCSAACRQALRRVLDREERWWQRRRLRRAGDARLSRRC